MSIRNFQQLEKIGEGAYSEVFKVKRNSDQKIYALKEVRLGKLKEKEKENSLNEIRILASVASPQVVAYKEAFFDDETGKLWLVMEYAENGDLYQKITQAQKTKKFIDEGFIWKMINQLVLGLQDLHRLSILHRDLKSANVFLFSDDHIKLGDMNVSKVAKQGMLHTQTGTPYYASPEVWKDKPYDAKSDIWSLGCVIYEAAALHPPFRANSMQSLYLKVLKGEFPRLPYIFSDDLNTLIKSLLQVNPFMRPSWEQILKMPLLQNNVRQPNFEINRNAASTKLLQTIYIPRDLSAGKFRMPDPQYDDSAKQNVTLPGPQTDNTLPFSKAIKRGSSVSPVPLKTSSRLRNSITPQPHKENQVDLKLPPVSIANRALNPVRNMSGNDLMALQNDNRSRRVMINRAYNILSSRDNTRKGQDAVRNVNRSLERYSQLTTKQSTNTSRIYRPQLSKSKAAPPWWG